MCLIVPPPSSGWVTSCRTILSTRVKVMSTGVQSSSIGLTAFTTRLDGLRPDQNPDDLSNVLRAAFKQRELYNVYTSSLVEDTERTKALLEVFDKVRSAEYTVP